MALRDLTLRFRLDDQVSRKLGGISNKLGSLSGPAGKLGSVLAGVGRALMGIAVAGGAAAVAAGAFVMRTVKRLDEIGDTASRLQTTTDTLQELAYAARFSDMEFEQLVSGLDRFNKNRKKLGLKGDLRDEILRVAKAFTKLKTTGERADFLKKVFGPTGTAFFPLFEGGAKRLEALLEEAHRRGQVRSREEITAASAVDDNIKHLKDTISAFGENLAGKLIPHVADLTGRLDKWLQSKEGLQTLNNISEGIAAAAVAMANAIPKIGKALNDIDKSGLLVPFKLGWRLIEGGADIHDAMDRTRRREAAGFGPGASGGWGGPVAALPQGAGGEMFLNVRLLDPRGLLIGQGKGALRPGASMNVSGDLGPVMATP